MSRVLVVDARGGSETLQEALRRGGHDVRAAGAVAQARAAARGWAPDLLLTDLDLPDGDGVAVADAFPATPAVVLAGCPAERMSAVVRRLPQAVVLHRPVSAAVLATLVHALLGGGQP